MHREYLLNVKRRAKMIGALPERNESDINQLPDRAFHTFLRTFNPRRVLSPQEEAGLRKVETTKADARQILLRNLQLLADLYFQTSAEYGVGCPHCSTNDRRHFRCTTCRWQKHPIAAAAAPKYVVCGSVPFGGVTLDNSDLSISYGADFEDVFGDNPYHRQQTYRFLVGNVEWALLVLGIVPKRKNNSNKKGEVHA